MTPTAEGPAVNGPTEREQRDPMLSAPMARAAALDDKAAGQYARVNPDWLVALIDHAARVAVLEQQIAAVLAIHGRRKSYIFPDRTYCAADQQSWPCETALAAGVDPKGSMVVDNPTEPAEEWDGFLPRPKRRVVARYVMKRTDNPTEETS